MPGVSRWVSGRPSEHALMAFPRRDLALTAVTVLLTVVVLAAVADSGAFARIQRLDDSWQALLSSHRSGPATTLALLLNVLGSVRVMLPLRVVVAGWLALRRRWWHLAAFLAAVVTSEVLIGRLKVLYDRPRPAGSMVSTSGASFPSGHAVAASATMIAGLIALLPPGRRRVRWGAAAGAFVVAMTLSRAYLGAHWLSDAIAGTLVGTSCALLAALAVGGLQGWWEARRHARPGRAPVLDMTPEVRP